MPRHICLILLYILTIGGPAGARELNREPLQKTPETTPRGEALETLKTYLSSEDFQREVLSVEQDLTLSNGLPFENKPKCISLLLKMRILGERAPFVAEETPQNAESQH